MFGKSVRLIDRPDMAIAVYRGRSTTTTCISRRLDNDSTTSMDTRQMQITFDCLALSKHINISDNLINLKHFEMLLIWTYLKMYEYFSDYSNYVYMTLKVYNFNNQIKMANAAKL